MLFFANCFFWKKKNLLFKEELIILNHLFKFFTFSNSVLSNQEIRICLRESPHDHIIKLLIYLKLAYNYANKITSKI